MDESAIPIDAFVMDTASVSVTQISAGKKSVVLEDTKSFAKL